MLGAGARFESRSGERSFSGAFLTSVATRGLKGESMASVSVHNGELPTRYVSKTARERGPGDVNVDHALQRIDVGWPLLRYGKGRLSRSSSLRGDFVFQNVDRGSETMPNYARVSSLENAKTSSGGVEGSFDVVAYEGPYTVEELIERQPPITFLKPCRQLEKQYSATRRSIAGQLTSLKGQLDRIAEDHDFGHSHGRFTARKTSMSTEKKDPVVHKLRRFKSMEELTGSPTSSHVPRTFGHVLRLQDAVVAPTAAIPFKWEDAPGIAKVDAAARRPEADLQLPPRLRQQLDPSWTHLQHQATRISSDQPKEVLHPHQGGHDGNQPHL